MSTIKVDTIATRTGSGNITLSNSLASATIAGDLTVDTNTLVVDTTNNNVFVKKTSAAYQTVGHELKSDGRAFHTSNGGKALSLVRNTSNGAIMDFYNSGGTEVGSIETSASGIGIRLGGTASANLLDDYEIGTFTPSYMQNGTTSYGTRHGSYVKIGNLCQVWWDLTVNSQSGASSTALLSLPFAAASSSPLNSANSQNMGNWWFWDVSSNYLGSNTPSAWIPAGNSNAYMYKTNGYASGHANWNINTTGRIACSVMYFTES